MVSYNNEVGPSTSSIMSLDTYESLWNFKWDCIILNITFRKITKIIIPKINLKSWIKFLTQFLSKVQLQRKTVHIHSFMLHWKSNHVRNSKLLLQWEFCSQSTLPRDHQLSMYYVIKILVFCTPLPSHLWLYFKYWT